MIPNLLRGASERSKKSLANPVQQIYFKKNILLKKY